MADINKKIVVENTNYSLIENFKDCFNMEDFQPLYTDYFYEYDYILGDYSYNKLRLKGYFDSKNKNVKPYNDIKNYKKYLKDFCANECPFFLIQKLK